MGLSIHSPSGAITGFLRSANRFDTTSLAWSPCRWLMKVASDWSAIRSRTFMSTANPGTRATPGTMSNVKDTVGVRTKKPWLYSFQIRIPLVTRVFSISLRAFSIRAR